MSFTNTDFVLFKDMDKLQKTNFIQSLSPDFETATTLIIDSQIGATSLLQRKMGINYKHAGILIDQMEVLGIVGVFNGDKSREVLMRTKKEFKVLLKGI